MTTRISVLFFAGVVLLTTPFIPAVGESSPPDIYAVPHDKSAEEPCREAALAARPGQIMLFHLHHTDKGDHYQYVIDDHDKTWIVICDAVTNKIIKNEEED